jgi:hypothetical protein
VKTKEGKETDFVIVSDERKPELLIEAKVSDSTPSPSLIYFSEKYHLSGVQVVREARTERVLGKNVELREATKFLEELAS